MILCSFELNLYYVSMCEHVCVCLCACVRVYMYVHVCWLCVCVCARALVHERGCMCVWNVDMMRYSDFRKNHTQCCLSELWPVGTHTCISWKGRLTCWRVHSILRIQRTSWIGILLITCTHVITCHRYHHYIKVGDIHVWEILIYNIKVKFFPDMVVLVKILMINSSTLQDHITSHHIHGPHCHCTVLNALRS